MTTHMDGSEPQAVPSEADELPPDSVEAWPPEPASQDRPTATRHTVADEIERIKRRVEDDSDRRVAEQARELLRDFIQILDDLDRALRSDGCRPGCPVREGVEMVRARFIGKLANHGVVRDDPGGRPFDPARHEALSTVPVLERGGAGRVAAVLRPGYSIGDDVLRPAGVVVTRAPDVR